MRFFISVACFFMMAWAPFVAAQNIEQNSRRVQYLFASNAGLIAFFDDGTGATCPRCDPTVRNLQEMMTSPHFVYIRRGPELIRKGGASYDLRNGDLVVMDFVVIRELDNDVQDFLEK